MYSSAVFTGVDLFALNFYLVKVVPHQPFLASENRRHGLPGGKDCILLRPLVDIIPECDRQTDRQTDMPLIAYTPLAKLALPCVVIKL